MGSARPPPRLRERGGVGASSGRRVEVAVLLGVGLGLVAAVWHIQSMASKQPGVQEGLKEVEEASQKLQELVSEAERKSEALRKELKAAERQQEQSAKAKKEQGGESLESTLGYPLAVSKRVGFVEGPKHSPLITPRRQVNPALADILERVAIKKELIVGISNINIRDMLETWFQSIQRLGIKNYLVVALDEATKELCESNGVPVYRQEAKIAKTQEGTGDNHAISSSKFHLIRDFLVLGYSVFLSDIDVLFLQNPFEGEHLSRDADVEGMTDGFSNNTAYGWDDIWEDKALGPLRKVHTMRLFVFNSGLFYIRPTKACIELLDRVADRLAKEKAWDQAVYNEEMFFPSHNQYNGLHISKRVLDFYNFLNSKTLFKTVRKDPRFADHMPVTIHINYHPDKYERMLACVDRYIKGVKTALDRFPDGSG